MHSPTSRSLPVLLVLALSACDPSGPEASVEIIAPAPTGTLGQEPYASIAAGESVQFSPTVRDDAGNVLDQPVAWEVRDAGFLSIDAEGLARGGSYVAICGDSRPPCGSTAVIARAAGAMDTLLVIPAPPPLLLDVTPTDTTVLAVGESAEFTLVASMPPEPDLWARCRTPGLWPQISDIVSFETISTDTTYPGGVWTSRSVYRATATAPGVTELVAGTTSTYCTNQVYVHGRRSAVRVIE